MNEKQKWMSSGFQLAAPTGEVSAERGIIEGVSICSVGEAKGHGVNLDSEFIDSVIAFGNEKRQGLKARFGHPNMCSTALGTFLGRFKNFREGKTTRDGESVKAAIGDLFISNEAKDTPHGDLHGYVMGMATNEADMFGTSIVFTPGREYKRTAKGKKIFHPGWSPDGDETKDEHSKRREEWDATPGPYYIECESLHACDAVDNPAANDGLFSQFSQETAAGQISEFLDLNPQVWQAVEDNPSILEAIARHGEKFDEFVARYSEYRKKGDGKMTEKTKKADSEKLAVEEVESAALEAKESEEETAAELAEKEEAEKLTVEKVEPERLEAEAEKSDSDTPELSREEFTRVFDAFGSDIAAQVMTDGGSFESALQLAYEGTMSENAELRERIAQLEKPGTGKAVPVAAAPEKEKSKSVFRNFSG
ncbi:MAG: hypothetical protein GY820_39805 [Gammaproteobacteria bacterium]|nr:hypothetical protein [Gammaproteobacteria bacterium]